MRALADEALLVDSHGIVLNNPQLAWKFCFEFGQGRQATAIALDGDYSCSSIQQRSGQATRPRSNLIYGSAAKVAGDGRDPGQQLPVEDEILAERLTRRQPVPRDDVAQRLGRAGHAVRTR